ncbi:MAG: DUF4011 domain-containing protein, partial [Evtepia sp.]
MPDIDIRIENWKRRLLDLSKNNRLINYRETKRSNLKITSPDIFTLYSQLVMQEALLQFPIDGENAEGYCGDLETDQSVKEQQKTLGNLRNKARTAMEEQGIHMLYLSFGFLKWAENNTTPLIAPLVLVPIRLSLESIVSPFVMELQEDEIMINPTLSYKLEHDFGLILPSFDSAEDDLKQYLFAIQELVEKNGWEVSYEVGMSLLSFLKINMYYDLEKNREKIRNHPILSGLAGDFSGIENIRAELNDYDHDANTKAVDIFQVVDADSSQQDAILYSKEGISFVLQGPPGTGKSQTITNIIAEALAADKKVLFVSEKMAALEVVYKRLTSCGLADFCLTLHSHKANRKAVMQELERTLNLSSLHLEKDALYPLEALEARKRELNSYSKELHTAYPPLGFTVYDINGRLAQLEQVPDVNFSLDHVLETTQETLQRYVFLIDELSHTIETMDYHTNPWRDCHLASVSHEFRQEIETHLLQLSEGLAQLESAYAAVSEDLSLDPTSSIYLAKKRVEVLTLASQSIRIPSSWILEQDSSYLLKIASETAALQRERACLIAELPKEQADDWSAEDLLSTLELAKAAMIRDLNHSENTDHVLEISSLLITKFDSAKTVLLSVYLACNDSELNTRRCESISEINEFRDILGYLSSGIQATEVWFDENKESTIQEKIHEMMEAARVAHHAKTDILNVFHEDILEVNASAMLGRYRSEYTPAFFDRIRRYEQDRKVVLNCFKGSNVKNDDTAILDLLNQVETVKHKKEWFTKQSNKVSSLTFTIEDFGILRKESHKYHELLAKAVERKQNIQIVRSEISALVDDGIYELDYSAMLDRFKMEYASIFKRFNRNYNADKKSLLLLWKSTEIKPDNKIIMELLSKVKLVVEQEAWFDEMSCAVTSAYGESYAFTFEELVGLETLSTILTELQVTATDTAAEIKKLEHDISEMSQDSIYEIDVSGILARFRMDYDSSFQAMRLHHREDYAEIVSHSNGSIGFISDDLVLVCLKQLREIEMIARVRKEQDSSLKEMFGAYYKAEATNWNELLRAFNHFCKIRNYYGKSKMPDTVKEVLNSKADTEKLKELESELDRIQTFKAIIKGVFTFDVSALRIESLIEKIEDAYQNLLMLRNGTREVHARTDGNEDFEACISFLNKMCRIQALEKEESNPSYRQMFEFMFDGIHTNWEAVISALQFAEKLGGHYKSGTISASFVEAICNHEEEKAKVLLRATALGDIFSVCQDAVVWYIDLFDGNELLTCSLDTLRLRVEKCRNDIPALEEWIDFREARAKCFAAGLSDFIVQMDQSEYYNSLNAQIFLKRFYRLWLNEILPYFPTVQSFRRRVQEETLRSFDELDLAQTELARLRLREKLIAKLPDFNLATAATDEVGILKREIEKHKKNLPLRVLFDKIPHLLLQLKPCLMMSPLSVSLFLQSDDFAFDLVVFDEASQVCTEDAIGAIMRAKQVVISGDSKQLPPTNFFVGSTPDDEFDSEEEEETEIFESILDEAVTFLPERTLKWHYRSRNEHLIAFSNAEIYRNGLMTFPAPVERVADIGVEYIYVKNGVYERGGRKCNINEANMVAKLVFSHIQNYPERSLGVVTFSEAQQQAIESVISQMRFKHQEYEDFFDEDMDESFFVKNLENVQGDERDTIIFSIGYAKDASGALYMDFGPLSRSGGYRRLNVAITRAKYNVKLVGSILPTDITLDRVHSDGLKMLRSYIKFAMDRQSKNFSEIVASDSPFEAAVCSFLQENGYHVVTQLGSSGYRMDMAVEHPTIKGHYILGIECDGLNYHSARTARERDRLRQMVLENIGWTIYHIWSTDWVNNPKTEQDQLLAAIKQAETDFVPISVTAPYVTNGNPLQSEERQTEWNDIRASSDSDKDVFGFTYYEEANLDEVEIGSGEREDQVAEAIRYIVHMEHPVHSESVCQRIAPLLGNQKVTAKVRESLFELIKAKPR